jgi:dGTPase
VPRETVTEIAVLKGVAAVYVMTAVERQPLYARQRDLLAELYAAVLDAAPDVLEPMFAADWRDAVRHSNRDAACCRVVIDQVASLSDTRAVQWYQSLVGEASG